MNELLSTLLSTVLTACSGILLFLFKRQLSRQQQKEERRDRESSDGTALVLRSLHALGKLTVDNSLALRDGKTNGEMTAALQEYEALEQELYNYLVNRHSHLG